MRSQDLRQIVALSQEVGEIGHPAGALEHLLTSVNRLIGAEVASLFCASPQSDCYRPGAGVVYGLDGSQIENVRNWYFDPEAPILDPLNRALFQRGCPSDTRTRRSLLDNKEWYANDHTQLQMGMLGVDDVLIAVRPVMNELVLLPIHRAVGARPFQERELGLLSLLTDLSTWFFATLIKTKVIQISARPPELPPRLAKVLQELLKGLSEKEIAAKIGSRPSTIHKYIELIYRTYAVNSRAELMALWSHQQETPDFQGRLHLV